LRLPVLSLSPRNRASGSHQGPLVALSIISSHQCCCPSGRPRAPGQAAQETPPSLATAAPQRPRKHTTRAHPLRYHLVGRLRLLRLGRAAPTPALPVPAQRARGHVLHCTRVRARARAEDEWIERGHARSPLSPCACAWSESHGLGCGLGRENMAHNKRE
jgi:hypothetical protein